METEKQQGILLTLSNEFTRARGKEDVLRIIVDVLKQHIPFDDSYILRYIKTTRTCKPFIYQTAKGRSTDPDLKRFLELEYPVLNDSIEEINYPLVYNVEALLPYGGDQVVFMQHSGIKEFVVQKLVDANQLTGLFILLSEQLNSFKQKDLDLLNSLSYQISTATANVIANEDIAVREEEKTTLLSLSYEIASLRNRNDLFDIVNAKLKKLFQVKEFGIAQINEDNKTYSAFVLDMDEAVKRLSDYREVTSQNYDVDDCIFSLAMQSAEPITLHVDDLMRHPARPAYVDFWKKAGFTDVCCVALKAGGKNIGCVFLHTDTNAGHINKSLLKGVCAQLSVAVSNILSNEEIVRREKEKSRLLMLSNAILSVRDKTKLATILKEQLNDLFAIKDYAVYVFNDDKKTLSPLLYDIDAHFAKHLEYLKLINVNSAVNEDIVNRMMVAAHPVTFDAVEWFYGSASNAPIKTLDDSRLYKMTGVVIDLGNEDMAIMTFNYEPHIHSIFRQPLFKSICSQIAVTVANIMANEKINDQLVEINRYKQQLEEEKLYLKEEIATTQNHAEIIGDGPEMKKVFRMVEQVASSSSTVLLLGETGTGKELIARAIHNASPRRHKLMIKVNCAALPPNLIESELFGHERGSFTGATERRLGKFELANHGTLFLDEIGEMPLELQVKLLRAIQEREIERVGGSHTIKVDVRIIAATNRDLDKMMEDGKFRTDLYYRLNIFPIPLPSLRNRREDIPALAAFFIRHYSRKAGRPVLGLSKNVLEEMVEYDWPGNIRELEHLVERSILLSKGNTITEIHLHPGKGKPVSVNGQAAIKLKTIDENEKEHILNILKYCKGKIAGAGGAAEILGVPASTLTSKMKKLGIKREYLS